MSVVVSKFRDMAERLQVEIDRKRADRQENTPKRQREAKAARIEADHLERTQHALYALADAQENGTLPPQFNSIKTKGQVMQITKTRTGSTGYYEVHDTGEFSDTSELAGQFRGWLDDQKSADQKRREDEQARLNAIKDMEAKVRHSDIPGFYPTPPAVIELMLERVSFDGEGVILEPSMGIGSLAEAAQQRWPDATIVGCEINHTLALICQTKGFDIHNGSFLEQPPVELAELITMNPPFENGQDAEHIQHAFKFLKSGGELIAVASAGVKFNSRAKYEAFRSWVREVDAELIDLPEKAFADRTAFRQTSVNTLLVHARKA